MKFLIFRKGWDFSMDSACIDRETALKRIQDLKEEEARFRNSDIGSFFPKSERSEETRYLLIEVVSAEIL
jgi:hypothetical protein